MTRSSLRPLLGALVLAVLPSVPAPAQSVPGWLDRAMGYTLHTPSYYNSGDLRAPTYWNPFEKEHLAFPGHGELLCEALAQKSRRFGARIVRLTITLSTAQPTPDDLRTLDFHGRLVERFARQGIAVVLQIDQPPGWMAPIATESFARRFASQPPTTPRAQTLPNTDLALYDAIWDRVIAPAQALNTPLKPGGEARIVISGRNEPVGPYAPLGHPLSIGLWGRGGEWDRMVRRFRWLDGLDGRNDVVLGSVETLGWSGSAPADAYTTHDYSGAGFPANTGKINVHTEVGDWRALANAHASIKYWALQRTFLGTFGRYVAHLVDDCDLGDRPNGGSPRGQRGKFWSDTQPRTVADLNLDSWEEPLNGGVGSREADLRNAHAWLGAAASNTLVRDDHAIVITHHAVPFYRPGTHPDAGSTRTGSYGFALPSERFQFDVRVRNLGRLPADVVLDAAGHNFRSFTLTPAAFTLPVDGVQRVTVAFDASNAPREGFHAARVRAAVANAATTVEDKIPVVVLADVDRDPAVNEPLLATGQLVYRAMESTGNLAGYLEGSQTAVYRTPIGKGFAPSHLRFHFGGQGGRNYNAVVVVDAWDEHAGTWDERHALVYRIDGNVQDGNPYATVLPGTPGNLRFARLDWPVAHWSNPLLCHALGFDGKGPLTGIRVRILSLDDPAHPETFAKHAHLEIHGKVFDVPPTTRHHADDFATLRSGYSNPDGSWQVTRGLGVASGPNLTRTTWTGTRYDAAHASVRLRLASADWAGLRVLMHEVDTLPWTTGSGYLVRVAHTSSGPRIFVSRADASPQNLGASPVLAGDVVHAFHELGVRFAPYDAFGRTRLHVFWNGTEVLTLADPDNPWRRPGHVGLVSYANGRPGTTEFDDLEINPAPLAQVSPAATVLPYAPGIPLSFVLTDPDALGRIDLDFGPDVTQGGLGLIFGLFVPGQPSPWLELPLSWRQLSALSPHVQIVPTMREVDVRFDSALLGLLRGLNGGGPVSVTLQGIDARGSIARRTTTFE